MERTGKRKSIIM